jgi:uncharacterized protein
VPDSSDLQPTAVAERLPVLDALRGVAILGVLLAYTLWNLGAPPFETWSRADRIIDMVGGILVDMKFLTIFAFLFGVGAVQQWRRLERQGEDPAPVHVRRMLFLLGVGLAHAALLRNGDILAPYAILGLLLLAARRRPVKELAVAAIALAILPYAIRAAMHGMGWQLHGRPGPEAGNLDWLGHWYLTNPLTEWPRILALMLAGVIAERAGLTTRVATDRRLAWRILGATIVLAILGRTALVLLGARWSGQEMTLVQNILRNQLYHAAAWTLAAAYAAAFALLCQRAVWVARLGWIRAVGRMAFTNYIVQALLIVPICLVFGLYDTVTPTRGLLLAIGVAALQIAFSVWWLRRFQFGPLEFVWRAVTYRSHPRAATRAAARG